MYELKTAKITRISGSHYVALPPGWIRNNKLNKGSNVKILLDSKGFLILEPEGDEDGTQ